MKKGSKIILIISVIIVALIFFYFLLFFVGRYIPVPVTFFHSCDNDAECVIVKKDCCGCNNDGEATTINNKHIGVWEKINSMRCSGFCKTITSSHPSCFSQPKCVNNKCQLIPKNND